VVKRFLVVLSFVTLVVFLSGCATQKFYMKTIKSKNTQITNNIKIAVIPENWYWVGTPNFLPRALITEFLDLGFTVVERSQLERIFSEVKLDLSGAVKDEQTKRKTAEGIEFGVLDKTSIKKTGELLGVDALLITYIVPTYDDNIDKATFRLVNSETAQVLFSITVINNKTDIVAVDKIIETISANIKQLLEGKEKILSKKDETGKIIISPQIIEIKKK